MLATEALEWDSALTAVQVGEEESYNAEKNVDGGRNVDIGVSDGSEDSIGNWPRDLVTFWSKSLVAFFSSYVLRTRVR